MKAVVFLLAVVHSVLILDNMSHVDLGKLSLLHAFISPQITPLIVPGDQTCVNNMRAMILFQLGMIQKTRISFDEFCSCESFGRLEIKDALKSDSSWITYQNQALQPCVDDFMLALTDKISANRSALCQLYSSDVASAGKLLAMVSIAILTLNF